MSVPWETRVDLSKRLKFLRELIEPDRRPNWFYWRGRVSRRNLV